MPSKNNLKKPSFWGVLWGALKSAFTREKIVEFFKGKVVIFALKKILGSAAIGGFKAWAIKFIVTHLYDEIARPLILFSFRRLGYVYEVKKGEHILKRIENAENRDDWRNTIGDA